MEEQITEEEIKLAIVHTKGNTASGLDDFITEFYKTFMEEFTPHVEGFIRLKLTS